jgi:hypothetical protein
VLGSNGRTYQTTTDEVAGCTEFNDGMGDYSLRPGRSGTGCVPFQVPKGVRVVEVEWSPSGFTGGPTGKWRVV